MNKIIVVSEKSNTFDVKKILKILTPEVEVDFIEPAFVPPERDFGEAKEENKAEENYLIFNFDNSELREVCKNLEFKKISFGFSQEADFFASDQINTEEGISFKLNHRGNSVPIWIKNPFDNEKIYNVLAAICVAELSGLNIVEISEKLKN